MKTAVCGLALLAIVLTCGRATSWAAPRTAAAVHCGTERWEAKTLSDSVAIDFNHPITTKTVSDLVALPRPSGINGQHAPRVPEETRVYTVHALLQEYKRETDHDFHIVISDFGRLPTVTMIAEIPDSACQGVSGDGWTAEFSAMRSAIEQKFGAATSKMTKVNAEVTITGALFFDFFHPTPPTGVAPNAVELHPVIALTFGPPTAQPITAPSAVPSVGPSAVPGGSTSRTLSEFHSARAAQQHCPSDVVVWLNTRSGLFHRKGHRYYGTTLHGAYVCEREAVRAGYTEGY